MAAAAGVEDELSDDAAGVELSFDDEDEEDDDDLLAADDFASAAERESVR